MSVIRPEVALCVIAGDDAIDEGFERMIASVEDKVDAVYVSYNGQRGYDGVDLLSHKLRASGIKHFVVSEHDWVDDFAAARQRSFDLATNDKHKKCDWLFWLDCDDVLPEKVSVRAACVELDKKRRHGGFVLYDYAVDDETGQVFASHYKERLFRADVDWTWRYPVHENCFGPTSTRMAKVDEGVLHVTHLRSDAKPKRERNRRIVTKWYSEAKDTEPRSVMMMAHETLARVDELEGADRGKALRAALGLYQRFIAATPPNDDTYVCNRQCADILRDLGRHNDSINIDLQGVKLQPSWPASYTGIAETYYSLGEYQKAIEWARLVKKACSWPDTLHVFQPLDLSYRPLVIEGAAQMKLGNPEEALDAFLEAQDAFDDDKVREYIKQARDAMVNGRYATDEFDIRDSIDHHWGTHSTSSVAFFTRPGYEDWGPSTFEKEGRGGTEQSVFRLARELASRNRRVVIYGSPGDEWGMDEHGVEWYPAAAFHPDEPFDVAVAVRAPEIFEANVNARLKVLWLHDVNIGEAGDGMARADIVVCPSVWHMKHTQRVYGNAGRLADDVLAHVIFNGFDLDLFHNAANDDARVAEQIVYSSSPDRGLDRLLDLMPAIIEDSRTGRPKLDVFYGWDTIDRIIESGAPHARMLASFKERIKLKIERLNETFGPETVRWRGRVTEPELAEALGRAGVMAYPANFCVAGDTPIDCPRDHERFPAGVPISMIEPGRLIWTINEQTQKFELKPIKRVWKSKTNAPVLRLTLDSGKTIRATADHRFMRRDGSWAELRALRAGDSLMPLYRDAEPLIKLDPNRRAGWSTEYRDVAEYLFGDRSGRHTHHVDERHYNSTPDNLQDLSPGDHFSLTHRGKKHGSSTRDAMSVAQRKRFALMSDEDKREMAQRMNRSQWDGLSDFEKKIKWHTTHPNHKGHESCEVCAGVAVANPFFNHKIMSVEPDGYEDVWDMEVEGNHNFVANGVVLHNCETFGISFQQAMAAGCFPVTCALGALPDMLPDTSVVSGSPDSQEFGPRFVDRVAEAIVASRAGTWPVVHSWDPLHWSSVADAWESLMTNTKPRG